jgi:hypothetical protein
MLFDWPKDSVQSHYCEFTLARHTALHESNVANVAPIVTIDSQSVKLLRNKCKTF